MPFTTLVGRPWGMGPTARFVNPMVKGPLVMVGLLITRIGMTPAVMLPPPLATVITMVPSCS